MQNKIRNGGFVLVEFAIALPLLVLVLCALGHVSINIYKLGKEQLADYVLESEARYAMERITQAARTAKEIEIEEYTDEVHVIKIIYHAVENDENQNYKFNKGDPATRYWLYSDKDVLETQIFIPRRDEDFVYVSLNAKRQESGSLSNPITGGNFFGDTKINSLKYDLDKSKKILHIKLEMESIVTKHKVKIATAVFTPGYELE